MSETEWDMQARLTPEWVEHGVVVDGEKLFLVAWEVMTSWVINDASKDWTKPSIDFLFMDQSGEIWLMEMKRVVQAPRDAWSSLCQVSHRVVALKESYSFNNLTKAYQSAQSGEHRRVLEGEPQPLLQAHQTFFAMSEPLDESVVGKGTWRRVVAAKSFGEPWEEILGSFASGGLGDIQSTIRGKYKLGKNSREFNRLMALTEENWSALGAPPVVLTVT